MAVGEHDDLAVVARLEELLGAAVHIADDRLGVLDALAVEHEPEPQHAVGGGVLRADVEHHVGAFRRAADADRRLRHGTSIVSSTRPVPPGASPWTSIPGRRAARPQGSRASHAAGPPARAASRSRPGPPGPSAPPPRPPRRAPVRTRPGPSSQGERRAAARDTQVRAAPRAGGQPGSAPAGARVQRHVRRDVAAAVRDRPHLAAVPEAGQGAERRPAPRSWRVVDRDREPGPQRTAPPAPTPRRAGRPISRRSPGSGARQRPPPGQPLRRPRRSTGGAQPFGAVGAHETTRRGTPSASVSATSTGTLSSHSLANSSPRDTRPAARPRHSMRGSRPAGRAARSTAYGRSRRQPGGQRRQHPGQQFAAPRAHVHERQLRGRPSASSTRAQQPRDRRGEQR